jgi:hypothetical protein
MPARDAPTATGSCSNAQEEDGWNEGNDARLREPLVIDNREVSNYVASWQNVDKTKQYKVGYLTRTATAQTIIMVRMKVLRQTMKAPAPCQAW